MEILTNILWALCFYTTGLIAAIAIIKILNLGSKNSFLLHEPLGLKDAAFSWLFVLLVTIVFVAYILIEFIKKIGFVFSKFNFVRRLDEWIKYG